LLLNKTFIKHACFAAQLIVEEGSISKQFDFYKICLLFFIVDLRENAVNL